MKKYYYLDNNGLLRFVLASSEQSAKIHIGYMNKVKGV